MRRAKLVADVVRARGVVDDAANASLVEVFQVHTARVRGGRESFSCGTLWRMDGRAQQPAILDGVANKRVLVRGGLGVAAWGA